MQVDELLPYLRDHRDELVRQLREGKVQTQPRPKGRNTQRGERQSKEAGNTNCSRPNDTAGDRAGTHPYLRRTVFR